MLDAARRAADSEDTAINSLSGFIDHTIDHGAELVLPMHGGPYSSILLAAQLTSLTHSRSEVVDPH